MRSSFASNQMAWQQTLGQKGFVRQNPHSDNFFWGTTGLRGATSWIGVHANGLATQINNVTGTRYFILLNRYQGTSEDDPLASMDAFPDSWRPWSPGHACFEHEGIILTPKSWL
jgi:hypothetical protein